MNSKCFQRSECRKVILPDTIVQIHSAAFSGCKNLESIHIPNSINSVDSDAFEKCANLKHTLFSHGLYLGNTENPFLILNKNERTYKPADGGELVVEVHPETRLILSNAFNIFSPDSAPYDIIDKLILHDNLESICGGSFSMGFLGFSKIETICIDSMECLCRAGRNIPVLAKTLIVGGEILGNTVTIPASVTNITFQCFNMCDTVETIRFEGNISKISCEAFCNCKNLKTVYFPQKVGCIEFKAFSKCPSLKKIEFFEVEKIERGAFQPLSLSYPDEKKTGVDGLREVVFHGRVGLLCDGAFSHNATLETVEGIDNVENFEGDPFCETPFENKFVI